MNRRPYGVLIAAVFTILLLWFVYSVAEILLLLFIAILFSLFLGAITESLQRRLGLPRPLGLLAAVLVTILAVTGIGFLMVPPLVQQTQGLFQALPELVVRWNNQLESLALRYPAIGQMLPQLGDQSYLSGFLGEIGGYFRNAVPYVFSGFQFFIHFISVLVMGIYLALRPALYREGFIMLAPPVHRELVRDILADLGRTLRAWIVGQLLAMFVLGVLTWIGLELLNVDYALAFGVFTGLVAIVPFFGTLVSTLLPALFVIGGAGGAIHALLVIALGLIVHLIEANFVAPMIMERQVHLPPVLSILAVLIMAHLLHLIGLLVAVPVLATVMVVGRRVYIHRVLEGKGFRRAVRDRPVEVRLPADGAVLVHPAANDRTVPAFLES
jgi:predicted PurR-regulated permease PerM